MIWKPLFDSDDPLEDRLYMCSNCGECIFPDDDETFFDWKYCPFCGEKDEEKKMIEMPITLEPYESYCNRLIEETHKMVKEMHDIVHCKDCKYWQTSKIKGSKDYHTCMCVRLGKEGIIAFADDFCSRGVKK